MTEVEKLMAMVEDVRTEAFREGREDVLERLREMLREVDVIYGPVVDAPEPPPEIIIKRGPGRPRKNP